MPPRSPSYSTALSMVLKHYASPFYRALHGADCGVCTACCPIAKQVIYLQLVHLQCKQQHTCNGWPFKH